MPRKRIAAETYPVVATELDDWVNPDTGQVMRKLAFALPAEEDPGVFRGRPPRGSTRTRASRGRKRRVSQSFAMIDAESIGMLDLSRQEYRVFSFLLSKVDGSGEIRVTNAYIAKSIGMTAVNVSKTMRLLRERQIVLAEGYGVWRINAWIAWVGEWKKWGKAAADDPEPTWSLEERPVLAAVE